VSVIAKRLRSHSVLGCEFNGGFSAGRKNAQQPESLAKRSATQRQHKQAIQNWKPSDLPNWLSREVYVKRVQPALAGITKPRICSALCVSEPYASDIRECRFSGQKLLYRSRDRLLRHNALLDLQLGCWIWIRRVAGKMQDCPSLHVGF
jgi:hypothetical protein